MVRRRYKSTRINLVVESNMVQSHGVQYEALALKIESKSRGHIVFAADAASSDLRRTPLASVHAMPGRAQYAGYFSTRSNKFDGFNELRKAITIGTLRMDPRLMTPNESGATVLGSQTINTLVAHLTAFHAEPSPTNPVPKVTGKGEMGDGQDDVAMALLMAVLNLRDIINKRYAFAIDRIRAFH